MSDDLRPELADLQRRLDKTTDEFRSEARGKRHQRGLRTARENLADLVDPGSFNEYGQLAVAAQRNRRDYQELQSETAADGVITGTGRINGRQAAVVIYDYSVLAGTQGYYHHHKLDRIFELAESLGLPLVMFTEGGGGRPGDTDIVTQVAGLNITSFATWARLRGKAPRIAMNNGFCFAGNAALFGCADITVATRQSWIGMAGPAMIEGGGLGRFEPTAIGPAEEQSRNGVVDVLVEDEAEGARVCRQLLSYFQGPDDHWECGPQDGLRDAVPEDRKWGYPVRRIIETLVDDGSFLELRRVYGRPVITGFARLEGRPLGVLASDCQQLGGAVDADSSDKASEFLELCNAFELPVLSLVDTPGFMVGPDSEKQAAVRRMSRLFTTGAALEVPLVAIFLRKGYGLGAMALAGGSFAAPVYAAAWPTGEFGAMGLEGAVRLGYRKELEAVPEGAEREALFGDLLARMIENGKATEAATHLELDAVIDPADTRLVVLRALAAASDH
ncbi:MAG: carboxyl transferase domain-containing protein [Xanthomonadales bacterium]|nr:carboxyl transferase domain-containing protein [Xanthomonadales bacterium]